MSSPAVDHVARLRGLLVARSVVLGDVTLVSGIRSDYYVDARRTTMSSAGQEAVGWVGYRIAKGLSPMPSHVGGLTLGADPISYAIAHRGGMEGCALDAFTVRKEEKKHGMGRRVEGPVTAGASCLVVEDCLTTGGSTLRAIRALREFGCTVEHALTLVDRSEGKGEALLRSEGVRLQSVFLGKELAHLASRAQVNPE